MNAFFKLFLILVITGIFIPGCARLPDDPEAARLYALQYAQKAFAKGLEPEYRIQEFMPVAENGCIAYGNNRHFMVILRGSATRPNGQSIRFRASLDVDMTGRNYKINPIIVDFGQANPDK